MRDVQVVKPKINENINFVRKINETSLSIGYFLG